MINPKKLEKIMSKLGLQTQTIDANEVLIRTAQKDIVIKNPQVTKLTISGQQTWQITGHVEEHETGPTKDDIAIVVSQTGASEAKAKQALIESGGDLAAAILKLKNES
jgi:nascent polypeptide-associated complex subunit alpha